MLEDSRQASRQEVKPTRRESSMASHTGGMRDNCQEPEGIDSVDMLSSAVAIGAGVLAAVPEDIAPPTYIIHRMIFT